MRALVLLALVVAALFAGLLLWTTNGHFVAPITDFYVVAQYARALAEGHPFQYNAGDLPTTGATSLLHTALLGAGHAAGARGEWLVAYALALGTVLFAASIPLAVRAATRLAGPREGLLAGALVALGGPVAWGYLYGSDIALFLFLALLVLERWLAYWQGDSGLGLALATALLALARPEGLPIALLLGAASFWRPGPAATRRERLLPWAGVVAGLFVLALQRALTGGWLSTSVAEKSLLPSYGPVETLAASTKYGVDVIRGLLLGLYPAEAQIGFSMGQAPFAFPPLGLLLVLIAVARPAAGVRGAARAWLAVVGVVFAIAGPNVFMGVHFNRYLLWAFPGLLVFAAAGLGVATRLVAREDAALERVLFRSAAGLYLLLGLLSTVCLAAIYSEMAGETWRREIPMADFIRDRLPRGVAIANAATSVEYLTGHRNLNLHGVTSAAFAGTRVADREAGLFESLVRMPAAERPPYLLLSRSGYEGSPLLQGLTQGAPLFETTSLGDELVLFGAKWDLLQGGAQPLAAEALRAVAGLREVDRLNTCDVRDEAAHAYRFESRLGEILLGASVGIDARPGGGGTLADAGRVIIGREAFRVLTPERRDLWLVLRTQRSPVARAMRVHGPSVVSLEIAEAGLVVRAGGRVALRASLPNHPGWNEHVLRIPAELLGPSVTELEISGRYAAYHYWFYQ
jgi:hypothetical protein